MASKWLRVRFYANPDDYRPVKWPPPGPFWCSGYSLNGELEFGKSVVIAYLKTKEQLTEFWPEAVEADWQEREEIKFTDRFPKPDWWPSHNAVAVLTGIELSSKDSRKDGQNG